MLYLINRGPGIQSHQTIKATEPEAENEVPIAVVLSDVEESNPNEITKQSPNSHITLEKFNTDADTDDDANARDEEDRDDDDNGDSIDNDDNGDNIDEDNIWGNRDDEYGEGERRPEEDDKNDEEYKEIIEKAKIYGTIISNSSNSRNTVFTPSEPTQDTTETSYEMFERRQRQVPITRPFVSRNFSCSSNSSQSSSSSSSQLVNSGRVTRGSATKRLKAAVTADEEDDNVDYFSVPKKGRKGKK